MLKHTIMFAAVAGLVFALTPAARADYTTDPAGYPVTVPVGNPGNASEMSGAGTSYSPFRECGAVDYDYNIGKYEVTAGQYTAFLNAVAGVDPYGLYNTNMGLAGTELRAVIQRYAGSGTELDPYQYRVDPADPKPNHPIGDVSFWDAARYANWLHNGQPTGMLTGDPEGTDAGLTEDGVYTLTAAAVADNTVVRNEGWLWAVTSADEWYKAAYHENDGVTGNYWDYPNQSDDPPTAEAPPGADLNGSANYAAVVGTAVAAGSYDTMDGGQYVSEGPYGTFDMSGNVMEWNEEIYGAGRFRRGAYHQYGAECIHAEYRSWRNAPTVNGAVGFRVVTSLVVVTDVPGDVDDDGDVDLQDLGYFEAQFGMSGLPVPPVGPNSADIDEDGDVDLDDLKIMRDYWGWVSPEAPAAATPEPASAILLVMGLGAVIRRRRS